MYNVPMRWLQRVGLLAIGCAVVIGGGGALVMRFELLTPEPTLTPALYGHALTLHALGCWAVLHGALLAIATLVAKPARGSVVLGGLALAVWAGAAAWLIGLELGGADDWPGFSQRGVLLAFAASLLFAAAQIALSLPARWTRAQLAPAGGMLAATRAQLAPAAGMLAAIAIVAAPLVTAKVPTAIHWLLATTAVAGGLIADAKAREARSFALVAIVPSLVLAWVATALVHGTQPSYFHDTVAVLSPLPLTGSALLGALLLAAMRARTPQRRLAHVAAALLGASASLIAVGFYVLGSHGLPRRYFAFEPDFQLLQIVVGAAAVAFAIGCVSAVEAFRRGTDSLVRADEAVVAAHPVGQ